jgi:hypothetical protein
LGAEIMDLLMNYISGGIPEPEKADVKYLQFEEPAEKQMTCLVDDDTRKGQRRDHWPGNKEHD